jgi:transposase
MKMILAGIGAYRAEAIAILAPYLAKNLSGKDISVILDNAGQNDRLNAIKSLTQEGSIASNSSADQMKLILAGIGSYRAQAIAILAPYLAKNLSGKDIAVILDNTSQNDRLSAINSLSQAGIIGKNLSNNDISLIMEGIGSYRVEAMKLLKS